MQMSAKREQWDYGEGKRIWIGKYLNSHNSPHWHYDCELLYVEQGALEVFCDQTTTKVCAGQAFYIDSEKVHYMHAVMPETMTYVVIFDYEIVKSLFDNITLKNGFLTGRYGINYIIDHLKSELTGDKPYANEYTESIIKALAISIFRGEETIKKEKSIHTTERLKDLLVDIDEKFEFYDLDMASKFMNMNATYFSRLFHKLTDMTFSQYLNHIKIDKAIEILNDENVPITEVSIRCGFDTIRNFNRVFKEFTGYTPKNIPKNFVMKERLTHFAESSQNPTFAECLLIESSSGV
jgi:xylan 1,4-beta-xylosidase